MKAIIGAVVVVALAIGGYFFWQDLQKGNEGDRKAAADMKLRSFGAPGNEQSRGDDA